jgi:NurA-like 5'-3' nuclease
MFRFRKKVDNTASLHLYRRCVKVINQLIPSHQKLWYDYVRLKYEENKNVTDPVKLKRLIEQGKEELTWMESVLERTKKQVQ